MPPTMMQKGQLEFLRRGGTYEMPLQWMREKGMIPEEGAYIYQEYPKALNLSLGVHDTPRQTEDCKGGKIFWTENREVIAPMVVESAAQEDAVRAAFERAEELGVVIQADWTPEVLLHTIEVARRSDSLRNVPKLTPEQIKAARVAALKAELATLEPTEALESAASPITASAKRQRPAPTAGLPVVAPDPEA